MARKYPPLEFGPNNDETAARFIDYEEVGKKLVEWATGSPANWPKTMDELRAALGPHATFPPQVTRLTVVQSHDNEEGHDYEFILRLPAKGQVSESLKLAKKGEYETPPVVKYLAKKKDEDGEKINEERQLYARVADYTMRQCR